MIQGTESNCSEKNSSYMTISYSASNKVYTLTNTADGNDPYATINGQSVYLETGKTYMMHLNVVPADGTPGSLQMFYAINGGYTESQTFRCDGDSGWRTFTVGTTGTYEFRFDNDYQHTNGGKVYISEFMIVEKDKF